MSNISDGISAPSTEQNVDIAQAQARQLLPDSILSALPVTGFVASLNALTGLLNLAAGTSSSGVTIVVSTDGVSTISIGVIGIGLAGVAPSNITAAAPTPSNDESQGWQVFSIWIDNTVPATPTIYMCSSNATMAAVWSALN